MAGLLLVDDDRLVRSGIRMLLSGRPDLVVVAEAGSGEAAVEQARALEADVILMDLRMPGMGGVAAVRELCRPVPGREPPAVLVLTTFDDTQAVLDAIEAGARGFILKEAAPERLVQAIDSLLAGDVWIDPSVARHVVQALATRTAAPPPDDGPLRSLTQRERQVLGLLAGGSSAAGIAQQLVVSEATVKTHLSHILGKTGARDRAAAVALAYRCGLVSDRGTSGPAEG